LIKFSDLIKFFYFYFNKRN